MMIWDVTLGTADLYWQGEKGFKPENIIATFQIIAKTPQQAKLRAVKAVKEWHGPRSENIKGDTKWAVDSALNLSKGFGHKWFTKGDNEEGYLIWKKFSGCWGTDFGIIIDS